MGRGLRGCTGRGRVVAVFAMVASLTAAAPTQMASGIPLARIGPHAVVIAAAGDICARNTPDSCKATAAQVIAANPVAVLTLGDNQYYQGLYDEFMASYDLEWGAFKSITYPAPGNHEHFSDLAGYTKYFGRRFVPNGLALYSYDIGAWHAISLDSYCATTAAGCGPGTPTFRFLRKDLAASSSLCTLVQLHHPRFSSGIKHGDTPELQPLWKLLRAAGVEIVLSGHEHSYERFASQTAKGLADPAYGITEYVIGTGGVRAGYRFGTPQPNSVVRISGVTGIGVFTLGRAKWSMHFVSASGVVKDSDSGTCHGAPPPR